MVENKLCLLWQNVLTRQWYHIGNLTLTSSNTYVFTYEHSKIRRGLSDALQDGYLLHPTFKDRYKIYKSEQLFAAFSRRLPNKNRKDYNNLMNLLNLSKDATEFEVLSVSGGKLVADNYEFVKPILFKDNKFAIEFFVRGWRHHVGDEDINIQGSKISLEREPLNPQDTQAVAVYSDSKKIGYVPAFYSDFIYEHLNQNDAYVIEQYEYNDSEVSSYKLNLKVSGDVDSNALDKYQKNLLTAL